MIRMIVFDMAGTVINEDNVVYKTLQRAINDYGIAVDLNQVLAEGAGKEKSQAIRDIVNLHAPGHSEDSIQKIHSNFLTLLEAAYADLNVKPLDGALELFQLLRAKGIRTVLNTGYNQHTADQLLIKLGWTPGDTFDELVTASAVAHTRPQPDMILEGMRRCQLTNPAEVLKIGDSIIDIEEGKNAGCGITVGITTGAHTAEQLWSAHPDFVIHQLTDLVPMLSL